MQLNLTMTYKGLSQPMVQSPTYICVKAGGINYTDLGGAEVMVLS